MIIEGEEPLYYGSRCEKYEVKRRKEKSLPITLKELPRQLEGVDEVEWLIINDGSQDRTIEVAIENDVDYVISHINNLGLTLDGNGNYTSEGIVDHLRIFNRALTAQEVQTLYNE